MKLTNGKLIVRADGLLARFVYHWVPYWLVAMEHCRVGQDYNTYVALSFRRP